MAGGVRLATGYITIEAETSQVPTQIKEALQKAGADAAKPVGTQMGKDLGTGIREGMNQSWGQGSATPGGIGKGLQQEITKGLDPKKTGTQVGKDLGTSIKEGMNEGWGGGGTSSGVGRQIQDSITEGIKPKELGVQIGTDIGDAVVEQVTKSGGVRGALKDLGGMVRDTVKEEAKGFGKEILTDVASGDVKAAFERVGDLAAGATSTINNLGHAVGLNLDSVERFGTQAATKLDEAGTKAQGFLDKFKGTRDDIKDTTDQLAGLTQAATLLGGTSGKIGGLSNLIKGIGENAGPIAAVYLSLETLAPKWKEPWTNLLDPNKPFAPSDLARIATPFIGVPEALRQEYFPNLPSILPSRPPWEGPKVYEPGKGQWAQPTTPALPPSPPQATTHRVFDPATGTYKTVPGPPPETSGFKGVGGEVAMPGAIYPVPAPGAAAPAGAASIGHATEAIQTASISVGSASLSGLNVNIPNLSLPSAQAAASSGGAWWGVKSHQGGTGALTQDELARLHKGEMVVPADVVHGAGGDEAVRDQLKTAGKAPGGGAPPGGDAAAQQAGQGAMDALDAMRTAGFVPAAAGQQTVAGTSFVAGLLNMGNEAVGGLIDAGAAAAQQAISMAGAAASFGAGGQAAGAAAGIGIQMGAQEAKRAASYGFQMASIGADALIEQLFPFGAPRWIGYDYTKFAPHVNVGSLATTTIEKAMQAQAGKAGTKPEQQPGGPVQPGQMPGAAGHGEPQPKFGEPQKVPAPDESATPPGLGPAGGAPPPGAPFGAPPPGPEGGIGAPPPPPPQTSPAPPGPPTTGNPITDSFLSPLQQFDEGGWWMPGQPGINTTNRPEFVLSPQQLDAAGNGKGSKNPWGRGGDTYHITAVDADDVAKQIDNRKRLAMMQYGARP